MSRNLYFRRYNVLLSAAILLADMLTLGAAFLLAYRLRADWESLAIPGGNALASLLSPDISSLMEHAWLLFLIVPLWEGALAWTGVFKPSRTSGYLDIVWTAVASVFVAAGMLGGLSFALHLEFMSRGVIILFTLLSAAAIAAEKCALAAMLGEMRRRNRNLVYVLVVGTGSRAREYLHNMQAHPEWGMRAVGCVDIERGRVGEIVEETAVLGTLDDIPRLLAENVIDLVAFIVPRTWLGDIGRSIHHCELQGVDVQVALDLFDHDIGRVRVLTQGNLPVLALEATAMHPWQAALKRSIDVLASGAALLLLSPLMLAIAAAIRIGSPGPALYRQARHGLHGRKFQMLKFRSMVANADELLDALRDRNEMSGAAFKLANDPRVTRLGRVLRRYSLDELPQLINVLRGDMSLVGPRPLIASENDKYQEWQRRRMSVRPGLTCLWQINGRNAVDFEHWMKLDLEYIDNWSILMDLRIMAKTVPALIHGRGAY